jgi:prophage regulatory protein
MPGGSGIGGIQLNKEGGMKMTRIMREREVKQVTGLSRVTRWRLERKGEFPKRLQLTERCVGWSEDEVQAWLKERADARNS